MKTCKIKECKKKVAARDLCHMHYKRWARHGNPEITKVINVCQMIGCEKPHFCKGYCENHYRQMRRQVIKQAAP
ncbi:hypothetical protein M1K46_03555 [Fictibacillus sp. WQ 8-8]|uniref:hypothetical protein n=1 Tax=Fictibacillus sp. WQ 8-8 TaxID=2938788 RepID=UPI00210F0243|nr:hypothetical protein [Fictibacillus sp. WQ 8-8]MCQ6264742.1 hypothetical protein [Fictibacillus sp. WQ 8-8]